jgi:hypothetical protein
VGEDTATTFFSLSEAAWMESDWLILKRQLRWGINDGSGTGQKFSTTNYICTKTNEIFFCGKSFHVGPYARIYHVKWLLRVKIPEKIEKDPSKTELAPWDPYYGYPWVRDFSSFSSWIFTS